VTVLVLRPTASVTVEGEGVLCRGDDSAPHAVMPLSMSNWRSRSRSRSAARPVIAPAMAFAGWLVFTGYLLLQANAGPAIVWNDSLVYRRIASAPLTSSGFWTGQRPPGVPLLIKVVGSSGGYLMAQAVVAGACWGALAWTVGRLVAPGWRRVVGVWVILAFASAFPVTLWNRSVLSESLSMSLLALVCAALIWTARQVTWPRVAATTVACLCFAATRDAQVWTVAFLALAVGVRALVIARSEPPRAIRVGVLSACLVAVVVLTGWGTVASHRTPENVGDVLYVRIFPYPGRVAWFAAHGMPQSAQVDSLARQIPAEPGQAKVVAFSPSDRGFAPLQRWILNQGTGTYLRWLVTHPAYVISEPLLRPERSYNFAQGNLTAYASSTDQYRSPLTVVVWPPLIGLVLLAMLAGYLTMLSKGWRDGVWRMMLVFTGIGVVAMLVAWHGDGQEVTRHTVEGLAQLRLGLWIIILLWFLESAPAGSDHPEPAAVGGQEETGERGAGTAADVVPGPELDGGISLDGPGASDRSHHFLELAEDHWTENHWTENHWTENHWTENHWTENHWRVRTQPATPAPRVSRRRSTAAAIWSSTSTVVSQPMQASVMLCPGTRGEFPRV
jgi:hypothetical protein